MAFFNYQLWEDGEEIDCLASEEESEGPNWVPTVYSDDESDSDSDFESEEMDSDPESDDNNLPPTPPPR